MKKTFISNALKDARFVFHRGLTSAQFGLKSASKPDPASPGRLKRFFNWLFINGRPAQFMKQVAFDYKNVALDTLKDCRTKPLKTFIYVSAVNSFLVFNHYAPNEKSFRSRLLYNSNEIGLVGEGARNPITRNHLKNLQKLDAAGQLRYQKLLFFSVMWRANNNKRVDTFEANCKHLQPDWTRPFDFINQRLLDIGFCGQWMVLENSMREYDVNIAEFEENSTYSVWSFIPILTKRVPIVKVESCPIRKQKFADEAEIRKLEESNVAESLA